MGQTATSGTPINPRIGQRVVAYLLAADIVARLPSYRPSGVHQPVIMTRSRFSTPRSSLSACLGVHASRSIR